ncbi:hypothetical protein LIER_37957 [Lithospermum erythrorhizon]|uniref:Polyprotein n=1 Tax=Lithospermum erythrorhizon TaxID=34254 RepID=A0AAV3PT76_LITER
MNAMASGIGRGFVFAEDAKVLVDEIKESFGGSNGPRVYDLRRKIYAASQGVDTVSKYYNTLKIYECYHFYDLAVSIDSGATTHMCYDASLFASLSVVSLFNSLTLPDSSTLSVKSIGVINLFRNIKLYYYFLVPSFKYNMLSVGKLSKDYNLQIMFLSHCCILQNFKENKVLFLGDSILTATHIINLFPTPLVDNKSLYEFFHSSSLDIQHLTVFGCLVFHSNTLPHNGKFDHRTSPGIFIRYPPGQHTYKIFDLATKKVVVSRDIFFHEHLFPYSADFKKSPLIPNDQCAHNNTDSFSAIPINVNPDYPASQMPAISIDDSPQHFDCFMPASSVDASDNIDSPPCLASNSSSITSIPVVPIK